MKSIPSDWKKVGVICLLFFIMLNFLQTCLNLFSYSMLVVLFLLFFWNIPYYMFVHFKISYTLSRCPHFSSL